MLLKFADTKFGTEHVSLPQVMDFFFFWKLTVLSNALSSDILQRVLRAGRLPHSVLAAGLQSHSWILPTTLQSANVASFPPHPLPITGPANQRMSGRSGLYIDF